tara:strand:- start:1489 stop:1695 length:207 start_codon:yes stop_codon:yes gene_type:complete
MNVESMKSIFVCWLILAVAIIYVDSKNWANKEPISKCCNAEVRKTITRTHYERYWCTGCKLFCEVVYE